MSKTERIAKRFPQFYRATEENRLAYKILESIAERLDQVQVDFVQVMMAHWVDRAESGDLDKLGALFNLVREEKEDDASFMSRIKSAIRDYRGGGTFEALRLATRKVLGLPEDFEIIPNPDKIEFDPKKIFIIENPSTVEVFQPLFHQPLFQPPYEVRPGDKWDIENRSVLEAIPSIEISVVGDTFDQSRFDKSTFAYDMLVNPTITNTSTGESVKFTGIVSPGQTLRLYLENKKAKARLDTLDVTDLLEGLEGKPEVCFPRLPKGTSTWKYEEGVGGLFDQSRFDKSVFAIVERISIKRNYVDADVRKFEEGKFDETKFDNCVFKRTQAIMIKFRWTRYEPATFEMKVPALLLSNGSPESLIDAINQAKAAGIRARIDYWRAFDDKHEQASRVEMLGSCHTEISERHEQTSQVELFESGYSVIEDAHVMYEKFEISGVFDLTFFDRCVFSG